MSRCLVLASQGKGYTEPNPLVGAVIVYNDKIIGEGFHKKYGDNHAEVEALNSVSSSHKDKIRHSTIYVNLEPCSHYGKTPPCADRLIEEGIWRVVIGTIDNHSLVCGRGIEKLRRAGIECTVGIMEKSCKELNAHFFTSHQLHRPYISLKWAQDKYGHFATKDNKQHWFTGQSTKIFTHKLRSEHQAIWVGTHTLLTDHPRLDNRLYLGNSPIKVVVDAHDRIPHDHPIFSGGKIIYISNKENNLANVLNRTTDDYSLVNVLHILYQENIISLMVEGGARLLQQFLSENLWDKAYRYIGNNSLEAEATAAPPFTITPTDIFYAYKDKIEVFLNPCFI